MNLIRKSLILISALFILEEAHAQLPYDWGVSMGSSGRDELTDLSIDPNGNVVVTGIFEDSIDASNGDGTHIVRSNGWRDLYLAKYDPTGQVNWAFGLGNTAWDRGWSITTDEQGAVYAGGVFSGSVDFDPSGDSSILQANPRGFWPDGYLAKYDTDGNLVWANHLLTARDLAASQTATLLGIQSMVIDGNGDLIVGGMFWDTVWLSSSVMLVSDGPLRDMFLAKYDTDGNLIWGQQMGGPADQQIDGIAVDDQGNIFASGYFFGTADFDPSGNQNQLTSEGAADMFLAKYTSTGSLEWVHGFGSADAVLITPESGRDVAVDAEGNVYLTGHFFGPIDIDPSAASDSLSPIGSQDVLVAKFNGMGELIWGFGLGGPGSQTGRRIVIQEDGTCTVAGEYGSSVLDLDPSADSSQVFSLSAPDVFIANYNADGQFISGRGIRGLSGDELFAMDAQGGEVVIGGLYFQSILLDQSSGDLRFSKGDADIFLAKYGEGATTISREEFKGSFSVFPNPAQEQLNIAASWDQVEDVKVILRSFQGQIVEQWSATSTTHFNLQLPTDSFSSGLYLVEIHLPSSVITQKVVIR